MSRPMCSAHNAKTGQPCQNRAMGGATVCYQHGGKAKQVKAKAAERIAESDARQRALAEFRGDQPTESVELAIELEQRYRDRRAVGAELLAEWTRTKDPNVLSAWHNVDKEATGMLLAIAKLRGPAGDEIVTIVDLLTKVRADDGKEPTTFTLNTGGWEGDPLNPPLRAVPAPAPPDDPDPMDETPRPVERQDKAHSASPRHWRQPTPEADAAEAEVLERSPWKPVPGQPGWEEA